jgi:hypothetical protein
LALGRAVGKTFGRGAPNDDGDRNTRAKNPYFWRPQFSICTGLFFATNLDKNLSEKILKRSGAMLDKSSSSPPSTAEKREKFVKLAENRTRNAIRAIRVIGKLGNKNAYQFDESDVQKIVRALNKEIEGLKARMSQTGAKDTIEFEL